MRRLPHTPLRVLVAICALAAAVLTAACGKKGPPLPPFARAPVAPPEFTARRQGDQVLIRFVVPQSDLDGRQPAHVDRVEVYALSAASAAIPIIEKYAEVVATIPVRPPPPPDLAPDEPRPPPVVPAVEQGAGAVVVDELSPEELTLLTIPEIEEARRLDEERRARLLEDAEPPKLTAPDLGPAIPAPPQRYYVARGRSGGRRGAWSARVPVPLTAPPLPPSAPAITVQEGSLALEWTPPERMRRPILKATAPAPTPVPPAPGELPLPEDSPPLPDDPLDAGELGLADPDEFPESPPAVPEPPAAVPPVSPEDPAAQPPPLEPPPAGLLPARLLSAWPTTVTGFVVDEVAPPGFAPPDLLPGEAPPYPVRLTPTPLGAPLWTASGIRYGVQRCFVVRSVETTGALVAESVASPPTCVTPADTFAPAPPSNLAAVASEQAISLIWEPSPAADVAGYRVLRAEAGGRLQPLTRDPITDTTYRDDTVQAGVRYVYAIVAVDTATPPNVSAPSNQVEETAR